MQNVVAKARSTGNDAIMVCERGFTFGYNNLVSDMRSLIDHASDRLSGRIRCHSFGAAARRAGVFLGRPARIRAGAGARGGGGRRRGIFMETHPEPAKALSDGRTPGRWRAWSRSCHVEGARPRSEVKAV
jgi:2-dehydro-3-deoxyphosphooctonate aldolase (KDO 8-P synthase)